MIKSKTIDKEKFEFPCLMKHKESDLILLMTDENCGTVIQSSGYYDIGQCFGNWHIEQFVQFNGKVILENE